MAKLVPGDMGGGKACGTMAMKAAPRTTAQTDDANEDESAGGCGSGAGGRSSGGEMAEMEKKLQEDEKVQENGLEVEITSTSVTSNRAAQQVPKGQRHDRNDISTQPEPPHATPIDQLPASPSAPSAKQTIYDKKNRKVARQKLGQCERCGYISSQAVCKACMLLEGLNRNRPKTVVDVSVEDDADGSQMMRQMETLSVT